MAADSPQNPNWLKPAMPQIPGVSIAKRTQKETGDLPHRMPAARIAVPLAGALVVGAVVAWWMLRSPRSAGKSPPSEVETQQASGPGSAQAIPAASAPTVAMGSVQVATLAELARPWSAKKFFFRKRFADEAMPAIVVRLPGGAANLSASYWAFSLQAPYGRCELEYVTDLARLKSQYSYRARYPMVADSCNGTIYDPLRMGTVPGGAWARGEVAQGGGIRPPISIDVRIQGDHLVATQIE